jgi:uncharacterized protein
MLNLKSIVRIILTEYELPWTGTHGVSHWARVLENGLRLTEETGADIDVVRLFAIFHDSQRVSEGTDDEHGRRGAELAARHRSLLRLSDGQFDLLYEACAHHTDGMTEADITIQACWDADRLDLGRVGIEPTSEKLCTPAPKRRDILMWADGRAGFQVVPKIVTREWAICIEP